MVDTVIDNDPATHSSASGLLPDDWCLDHYDYQLPDELIARYPLPERQASRMLAVDVANKALQHDKFARIEDYLQAGDLLVLNDTKVLPLRLHGRRIGMDGQTTPGKVEALLLTPDANDPLVWEALVRPAKKLPAHTNVQLLIVQEGDETPTNAQFTVLSMLGEGRARIKLDLGPYQSVTELLETAGQMPIPPYFRRQAEALDKERYQTVFAHYPGSQAAPTAGLHFTKAILDQLRHQGVQIAYVTLTVGIGTFRGVQTADIRQHQMHGEHCELSAETADLIMQTKAAGKRVLAVGTTVAKTLETVARWQGGQISGACRGFSELFIYPGFEFLVIDGLLTNFHLPKSSLLMLVSALAGRELMLHTYQEAVRCRYRFYSYGDCMWISGLKSI
jgi:S-adenosylmethionine:tRNA ribosyltransferase-isomerase